MILDRKDRQFGMLHPFYRFIIEIDMGQFDRPLGDGIDIDRETVVLSGDVDLSGLKIDDRLVAAVMAEL